MPEFWTDVDPTEIELPPEEEPVEPPPGTEPAKTKCEKNQCANGTLLNECVEGKIVPKDCSAEGKVCKDGACTASSIVGPENNTCESSYCKSDSILVLCKDSVPLEVDCTTVNKICQNDTCKDASAEPECTVSKCEDSFTLKQCNEGVIKTIDCAAQEQICIEGTCIPPTEIPCTESICEEDGITLRQCNEGTETIIDCSETFKKCSKGACVEEDIDCNEEGNSCRGNVLWLCVNGKVKRTNCETDNMICDSNSLECVYECDETTPDLCMTKSQKRVCDNHKLTTKPCDEGTICRDNECVADPCASCQEGEVCIAGECTSTPPDTLIGIPCSCNSVDCYKTVSGGEIKSMFTNIVRLVIADYIEKIADTDEIVWPDFASPSNVGCETLESNVPEGMSVICMRDAKATFPQSMINFFTEDLPSIIAKLGVSSETIMKLIPKMSAIISNGIQISSPNGYCMTAALDFSGEINQQPASYAVNPNALHKGGIVDKINFGDHDKVVEASQAATEAGTSYCPPGSVLIDYAISDNFPKVGHFDIGIGMCLKTCTNSDDCREGYECIEMALTSPIEESEKTFVCFDKNNIDFFESIRQDLPI